MFRVGSGAASFSRMLKTATGTVIQHAGASNAGRVNRHTCSNAWNAMARHRTGIHSALRRGQQQQQQHITTISRFGKSAEDVYDQLLTTDLRICILTQDFPFTFTHTHTTLTLTLTLTLALALALAHALALTLTLTRTRTRSRARTRTHTHAHVFFVFLYLQCDLV